MNRAIRRHARLAPCEANYLYFLIVLFSNLE
jgi:hypothetical protein